ncbi:ATP-dependent DNA helicase [Larsenimonas suaedae]|uniref:AAA family ATPase n=1 Tax=Larsenimonas suaedae TaxID=1851019 RepID=A0ABU1GZ03_9GAMM|nr:AAA family ATPase [Larsenimonas suaedae]MCM2973761.1 AAA family ATPase [Larsenimonas suaedae]MDR5897285.1 AAA family ATPase [Larsenimonas suaedae]
MTTFTLSADQTAAFEAFCAFYLDPNESEFVLCGYSGTGKTTLTRYILDNIPRLEGLREIVMPNSPRLEVALTATTNKAAENFGQITGQKVQTIHRLLRLILKTDYETRKSQLRIREEDVHDRSNLPHNQLIFIDEASYIDRALLHYIHSQTINCKIVFLGDPAQLLSVGCKRSPVFDAGYKTAYLRQVMRQAEGNPIMDLSTKFRNTVETGEFFSFLPDGYFIRHLPRDQFEREVLTEFTRPDWGDADSKILAWTNKRVVGYNHAVRDRAQGSPSLQVGDYAICNHYLSLNRGAIRTDQTVLITRKEPRIALHDVFGHWVELDSKYRVFLPDSLDAKNGRYARALKDDDREVISDIEQWADLRAAYACTINKAQGSTYDQVFIDLDDLKKCRSNDQMARMLYVGVSRARRQVTLCGDLV